MIKSLLLLALAGMGCAQRKPVRLEGVFDFPELLQATMPDGKIFLIGVHPVGKEKIRVIFEEVR